MLFGFGFIAALFWLSAWRATEAATLLDWTGGGRQIAAVALLLLGASLLALSRLSLAATRMAYIAWMSATVPIGIVMSTILLTTLFVLVLPVFAIIVRFGDPMRKRLQAGHTYWEPFRSHDPTLERMQRPF